ncbi:TPA: PGF-pre-PGF domain-containing protein [Candidatus Woesearchaeota archaeon]|nr:PGF-pre-PGF domain-containing protein [Candidatus Woesearchaeota archaeon]
MRKEGAVNLKFFVSVLALFVLAVFVVFALDVQPGTPASSAISTARNINFTFTPTWNLTGETSGNCTLYTNFSGVWESVVEFNGTFEAIEYNSSANITNGTTSWVNNTFSRDIGNMVWAVGCENGTGVATVLTLTFTANRTIAIDAVPPKLVQTADIFSLFNTSSARPTVTIVINDTVNGTGVNLTKNGTINISIYDVNTGADTPDTLVRGEQFQTVGSNITCSPSGDSTDQTQCTFDLSSGTSLSNGTKNITIVVNDRGDKVNITAFTFTVDQIPPLISYFNITTNSSFNTSAGAGVGDGSVKLYDQSDFGSVDQGTTIFIVANWTDNLTQPSKAVLQVYNETISTWVTYNVTNQTLNISPFANGGWSNFSFAVPTGHNLFEGRNVSFRILGNDTLGNVNNSAQLINITVQVNDTTVASISIPNGTVQINGTNTTDTTPTISWEVRENNPLTIINVSVDNATQPGTGENSCKTSAIYTTAAGLDNVERHRNGSFTVESDTLCTLTNGTHIADIIVTDIWGNRVVFEHKFNVQVGSAPGLFFNLTFKDTFSPWSKGNVPSGRSVNVTNSSINITSAVGITLFGSNGVGGVGASVDKILFVSSCDSSTTNTVDNNTVVFPFNASACLTSSANRTLTVTINDTAGNSNTTVLGFLVDNVGPTLTVNTPTNGQLFSNEQARLNVSVLDNDQAPAFIGYYLDRNDETIYTLNISRFLGDTGATLTSVNLTNFTAGTHAIKFTVNDTLGNAANSSWITFVQVTPVNFGDAMRSLLNYSNIISTENVTNVSIRVKAAGAYEDITTTNTSADTYQLLFQINGSINVSLTDLNGSTANWDRINFTPLINDSPTNIFIQNNWSTVVIKSIVFNSSIAEFITNNNSYYGEVEFNFNNTGGNEFWWIVDTADVSSRTNISVCTAAFTSTTTTPCFNYTKNGRTIVYVPHFSVVVAVNDTVAPTINITYPNSNQTVGMFIPNITVSPDAVSCKYTFNFSTSNQTMAKTGNVCVGQTEALKNNNAVVGYNITFSVEDGAGNVRMTVFNFNVSDTTVPNNAGGLAISSSPSTTTATVTVSGVNESVNVTVFYGTAAGTLTSGTGMETDFNSSQSVSISSLSASTLHYYNVTICDYNGNCVKNGTYNFTTSAAASTSSSTSSSSSGGGGGGTVETTAPTVTSSTSRVWDAIASGATTTLTVGKDTIAVDSVAFTAAADLKSAGLTVGVLDKNPASEAPADAAYQYLEIKSSNIGTAAVKDIQIAFKVPISWVDGQSAKKEDITLYRYTDGAWTALPTTYASSDGTYYYYTATTPGFSYFAIGTKKGEATPAPGETPSTPEQPTAEKPGAASTASTGTQEDSAKKSSVGIWIIVAAVALIIVVALAILRQKRQNV